VLVYVEKKWGEMRTGGRVGGLVIQRKKSILGVMFAISTVGDWSAEEGPCIGTDQSEIPEWRQPIKGRSPFPKGHSWYRRHQRGNDPGQLQY